MHKSHKGIPVDMDALRIKNEKAIAAGNMGVNAKGDKLGKNGTVEQTAKDRTKPYYSSNPNAVKQVSIKPDLSAEETKHVQEEKNTLSEQNKKDSSLGNTGTSKNNDERILENGDIVVEETKKK